jgi:hypothetical protein
MLLPEQPVLLSLNSEGCWSVTGIKIYPYALPVLNVTYEFVGSFVMTKLNVDTLPLVIVEPVNLP